MVCAAGVGSLAGIWLGQMPGIGSLSLLGRSGRFTDSPAKVCQALLGFPSPSTVVKMRRCDVATSEESASCFGCSLSDEGVLSDLVSLSYNAYYPVEPQF